MTWFESGVGGALCALNDAVVGLRRLDGVRVVGVVDVSGEVPAVDGDPVVRGWLESERGGAAVGRSLVVGGAGDCGWK